MKLLQVIDGTFVNVSDRSLISIFTGDDTEDEGKPAVFVEIRGTRTNKQFVVGHCQSTEDADRVARIVAIRILRDREDSESQTPLDISSEFIDE